MATGETLAAASSVPAAELEPELGRLEGEGMVEQRGDGEEHAWMLSAEGLGSYERLLDARRQQGTSVAAGYESFLELNRPAKELISAWQQGVPEASAALAELEDICERAGEALRYAGRDEARFERYADRLEQALERVWEGDERYVGDPALDSFHTVWFECHEDFLLTLGLSREE